MSNPFSHAIGVFLERLNASGTTKAPGEALENLDRAQRCLVISRKLGNECGVKEAERAHKQAYGAWITAEAAARAVGLELQEAYNTAVTAAFTPAHDILRGDVIIAANTWAMAVLSDLENAVDLCGDPETTYEARQQIIARLTQYRIEAETANPMDANPPPSNKAATETRTKGEAAIPTAIMGFTVQQAADDVGSDKNTISRYSKPDGEIKSEGKGRNKRIDPVSLKTWAKNHPELCTKNASASAVTPQPSSPLASNPTYQEIRRQKTAKTIDDEYRGANQAK